MNSPNQVFEALRRVIDLPDGVIELSLSLKVDETPQMTITKFIDINNEKFDVETKRFSLVEKT